MADPVAEVLAEHVLVRAGMDDARPETHCGGCEWEPDRSAGVLHTYVWRQFIAHQADALRAKGLVVSEIEWGVQSPDSPDEVIVAANDEEARRIALPGRHDPRLWPVVTRGVTPWRTADEGSEK